VPECAAPSFNPGAERLALDSDLGLALKARGVDGKRRWGVQGASISARRRARELAQMRRLFYVAVTRARDYLVLSGRTPRKEESWRSFIDQAAPEAVQAGLLRVIRDPGLAAELAAAGPAADPEALSALPAAEHPDVARVLSPAPSGPG